MSAQPSDAIRLVDSESVNRKALVESMNCSCLLKSTQSLK